MIQSVAIVRNPGEGLALEAKLLAREDPGVVLWTSETKGIVAPATLARNSGIEASSRLSTERGWPVFLRPTGGGAVPQGPGVLSLAMSWDVPSGFTIEDGYRALVGPIQILLSSMEIDTEKGSVSASFCDGAWNLSVAGRKLVGTAQRWRPARRGGARVLAHAMILTHGQLVPKVAAINAFHDDLGLRYPVRADAHTTVENQIGQAPSEIAKALAPLHDAALREMDFWECAQRDRAAA